jgi:hypothetical protein
MRAWRAALAGCLATTLGAAGAACFDLFHSTADLRTACELEPATPGCPTDPGVNLCEPRDYAQAYATRACAWLGACEGPIGRNSFGACVVEARLAYDCEANPNHRIKGQAGRLWGCLAGAGSCSAVDACIFPSGRPDCVEIGSSCVGSPDGGPPGSVRLVCAPSPPLDAGSVGLPDGAVTGFAEDCALFGQTCSTSGDATVCTGSAGASGCADELLEECPKDGSAALVWCTQSGMDLGLDCASNGAQQCNGYPMDGSWQWVACTAEGNATCAASLTVTCDGGIATSCPSAVSETIDCTALLGDAGTCVPGTLDPPFDWTSPCATGVAQCSTDSCDEAGHVLGCMRGAIVTVDCAALGLGPCAIVDTGAGAGGAACTPR